MDVSMIPKSRKSTPHPPTEEVVTEGQRQLRTLLDKQLQKDVTIQQQLSQKRTFTGSSAHDPAVNKLCGLVNLQDFSDVQDTDSYIAELKMCGLTEEEINIKLTTDHPHMVKGTSKRCRYGIDPGINEERVTEIERKIKDRQKEKLKKHDEFFGQRTLTRHEMELETSLLKESSRTTQKISSMLTKVNSTREVTHPDDPMNHLNEILLDVTRNKGKVERHKTSLSQGKIMEEKEEITNKFSVKETSVTSEKIAVAEDSLHSSEGENESDHTTSKCAFDNPKDENNDARTVDLQSGDGKSKTTVVPSQIKELHDKVTYIAECDIQANRLSEEDFRKIPRFENYSPGSPKKTLYLKNLARSVTPADLVAMFGRYQDNEEKKIIYRLLSGRMKGQAFVEFKDIETATKALLSVNGYLLKGKPVIIQYSKT